MRKTEASKVASALAQRRWKDKTPEERAAALSHASKARYANMNKRERAEHRKFMRKIRAKAKRTHEAAVAGGEKSWETRLAREEEHAGGAK